MNLARAQRLAQQGRHAEAEEALKSREGARFDPRRSIVLADIVAAAGDRERAMRELTQACERAPDHAPSHLFRAIFAWDCGHTDAALAGFLRVLELQPDNDLARSYRALSLLKLERYGEAVAAFREYGFSDNRGFMVRTCEFVESQWLEHDRFMGARSEPGLPEGLPRGGSMRRAERAFYAHRYADVLVELSARDDDDSRFACGISAEMLQCYEEALGWLERIPDEDGADAVIAAIARCRLRLRDFPKAAEGLNRVLIIGPEDYGVNYYLAVLCLHYGETVRARQLFTRAFGDYLVDTLEYQFWQVRQAILSCADKVANISPAAS